MHNVTRILYADWMAPKITPSVRVVGTCEFTKSSSIEGTSETPFTKNEVQCNTTTSMKKYQLGHLSIEETELNLGSVYMTAYKCTEILNTAGCIL